MNDNTFTLLKEIADQYRASEAVNFAIKGLLNGVQPLEKLEEKFGHLPSPEEFRDAVIGLREAIETSGSSMSNQRYYDIGNELAVYVQDKDMLFSNPVYNTDFAEAIARQALWNVEIQAERFANIPVISVQEHNVLTEPFDTSHIVEGALLKPDIDVDHTLETIQDVVVEPTDIIKLTQENSSAEAASASLVISSQESIPHVENHTKHEWVKAGAEVAGGAGLAILSHNVRSRINTSLSQKEERGEDITLGDRVIQAAATGSTVVGIGVMADGISRAATGHGAAYHMKQALEAVQSFSKGR